MYKINGKLYTSSEVELSNLHSIAHDKAVIDARTVTVTATRYTETQYTVIGIRDGIYYRVSDAKRAANTYGVGGNPADWPHHGIKTPSDLKYAWENPNVFKIEDSNSHYFSRSNLAFFGEKMAGFKLARVRDTDGKPQYRLTITASRAPRMVFIDAVTLQIDSKTYIQPTGVKK